VFLSPDTIWSNGSIETVDRILSNGKRVIFLWSFRLIKEEAEPFLRNAYQTGEKSEWDMSARELNKIAFKFLHPTIEEYFFDPGRGEKLSVSVLLWTGPNGDILAHAFHQHPLLVYPRKRFANFAQTIDGDLVHAACPDSADHYIVQDSDEITAIELSKRSHFMAGIYEKGSSRDVAAWALNGANSVHWTLVPSPIRMHAHAIDPTAWHPVEARAAIIVQQLLAYRRKNFVFLLLRRGMEAILYATMGMNAPDAREWMFRRRHAVTYFIRNWIFRLRRPVSYIIRVFRDPQIFALSPSGQKARRKAFIRLGTAFVSACGRTTYRRYPRLHQMLLPTITRLRQAGIIQAPPQLPKAAANNDLFPKTSSRIG
jgi:hypothetical protein